MCSVVVEHLTDNLPHLRELFVNLAPISPLVKKEVPLPFAVTEIVVSQMLSGSSADAIFSRILEKTECSISGVPWRLSEIELAACGISKRKAFAIVSFGRHFEEDPTRFERWLGLDHEALVVEVSRFWGLSRWSADILALSYFGNPDVFPTSDGTLNRAIKAAVAHTSVPLAKWNLEYASPYRSYLARYLWKSIDTGYWDKAAKP